MSLGLLTSSLQVLSSVKDRTEVQYMWVTSLLETKLDEFHGGGDFGALHRKKTRLQLVLLSCAVCGIEFCYAAETAFVTPILLQIGLPVRFMSLVWGLSPLLGLLLVPILGSLSDRCSLAIGRRRPFIFLLSLGIILGLLLVPNGSSLGERLSWSLSGRLCKQNTKTTTDNETSEGVVLQNNVTVFLTTPTTAMECSHNVWSIFFTVLGVILLDFSCDACQSPCRAYLLDVSIPDDHAPGLSTFTIMAGLGGSLGYVMGGIDWEGTSFGEQLGGHVRVVFTLVLLIFLVCVTITMTSFREVPLSKLAGMSEKLQRNKKSKYRKFTNEDSDVSSTGNGISSNDIADQYGSISETCVDESNDNIALQIFRAQSKEFTNRDFQAQEEGKPESSAYNIENTKRAGFKRQQTLEMQAEVDLRTYLRSIIHLPRALVVLCVTNLFCWMSLVCYSLFFTDFVGQAVMGGDPGAAVGSEARRRYDDGVRLGSLGMSVYSASCSVYSLNIERLVSKLGELQVLNI